MEKKQTRSESKTAKREAENLHPHALSVRAVAANEVEWRRWKNILRIWHFTVTSMLADLYWGYRLCGKPKLVDLSELKRIREEAEKARKIIKQAAAEHHAAVELAKLKKEPPPRRTRDRHPKFDENKQVYRELTPDAVRELFYFAFGDSTSVGIKNPTPYYECRQRFFHYWRWYASQYPPEDKFPCELGPWIYDGIAAKIKAILETPYRPGSKASRLYGVMQGDASEAALKFLSIPFLVTDSVPRKRCRIVYPSDDSTNKNIEMQFDLNDETTLRLVLSGEWTKKGGLVKHKSLEDGERWWLRSFAAGYSKYVWQTPQVNINRDGQIKVFIPYASPGEKLVLDPNRHLSVTVQPRMVMIGDDENTQYERAVAMTLAVDNDRRVVHGLEKFKAHHIECQNALDKLNGFSAIAIRRAKSIAEAKGYRYCQRRRRRLKSWYERQHRTTDSRSRFVMTVNRDWVKEVLGFAEKWDCGRIVLAMPKKLTAEVEQPVPVDQPDEKKESVESKVERIQQGRSQGRLFGFPWQWHGFKEHLEAKVKEHGLEFELREDDDVGTLVANASAAN